MACDRTRMGRRDVKQGDFRMVARATSSERVGRIQFSCEASAEKDIGECWRIDFRVQAPSTSQSLLRQSRFQYLSLRQELPSQLWQEPPLLYCHRASWRVLQLRTITQVAGSHNLITRSAEDAFSTVQAQWSKHSNRFRFGSLSIVAEH